MSTVSLHNAADAESVKRTMKALAERNITTFPAVNRKTAFAMLLKMVPEGAKVFVNTSETLESIGYTEYMRGNPCYTNLHDAMLAQPDAAAQREFRRRTTIADYFVGSVQAIAETGEIVVASSTGSQIGAYSYGARQVILVAGTQKICPTLPDAFARTRGYTLDRHDRWLNERGTTPTPLASCWL